eukprot:1758661-Rhodomonas_salina.1
MHHRSVTWSERLDHPSSCITARSPSCSRHSLRVSPSSAQATAETNALEGRGSRVEGRGSRVEGR